MIDKYEIDFLYKYGCIVNKSDKRVKITGVQIESVEHFFYSFEDKIREYKCKLFAYFIHDHYLFSQQGRNCERNRLGWYWWTNRERKQNILSKRKWFKENKEVY